MPALILHADADRIIEAGHGRYLAGAVCGAKLVIYPARDHVPFVDGAQYVIRHVREFLTGAYRPAPVDSTLCTILFTDIVGSTRQLVERGDRAWADLLAAHNNAVRSELALYRGREVNNTGDGFMAIFDGPARSIRSRRQFATRCGQLASTCGWGCIQANARFRMELSPALPSILQRGCPRLRKPATSSSRVP